MDRQSDEKSLVAFRYEKSREHRVIHATGARGSITPGGEIIFELFSEALMPPDEEIHRIDEDGSIGKLVRTEPVSDVVSIRRLVEVSVSVSIADAERIGKWLLQKVDEGRSRQELIARQRKEQKNE